MALIAFPFDAEAYAQNDPPALTNTACPVTAGEAVDPAQYVEYQGQRVYFCCDKCRAKFHANPARFADELARVMPVTAPAPGNPDITARSPLRCPASTVGPANQLGSRPHGGVKTAHHNENPFAYGQAQPRIITTGATPRPGAGGAALSDGGNDHSAHEVEGSFFTRLINWFGKFHPPTTHFPIGLLTAAAMAELLFIKTKRPLFDNAAQFCVWLGTAGALAAVTLGWFYAGFHLVDDNWIMTTHRWLGTSVALLSLVVAWLSLISHRAGHAERRSTYRAMLFLTVLLVSATGFLGGAMIYGIDHYMW